MHNSKWGPEMPNDRKPDQSQIYGSAVSSLMSLALPWLSLRLQTLEIAKNSIAQLADSDVKKMLEVTHEELIPRVTSASLQLIEAQQLILTGIYGVWSAAARNAYKAEHPPKTRPDMGDFLSLWQHTLEDLARKSPVYKQTGGDEHIRTWSADPLQQRAGSDNASTGDPNDVKK
jgi:hypothetical protein